MYRTYYDIVYPNHERQAGRPLRDAARLHAATSGSAPSSARRAAGSGSTGTGRNEDRGARALPAAGLGRAALVDGDRHRAPRDCARRPALFDESSFAKIEVDGPGCGRVPRSACAPTDVDRAVGSITYTSMLNSPRRHRVRRHRHPARGASASSSSPAPPSAATTGRGSSSIAPTATGRCRSATSRRRWRASGCGARGRATSCRRCAPTT